MSMMNHKSYRELVKLPTFEERLRYLKLANAVGESTFGSKRYMNQVLYTSYEWRKFRDAILVRDNGCDLGLDGYSIGGLVIVHHLNPLTYEDITEGRDVVFDYDNVVCTSLQTHNDIHFGIADTNRYKEVVRIANDTCPWRRRG